MEGADSNCTVFRRVGGEGAVDALKYKSLTGGLSVLRTLPRLEIQPMIGFSGSGGVPRVPRMGGWARSGAALGDVGDPLRAPGSILRGPGVIKTFKAGPRGSKK